MNISERINAFVKLGDFLNQFSRKENTENIDNKLNIKFYEIFEKTITRTGLLNHWFTEDNIRFALNGICNWLKTDTLEQWVKPYYSTQTPEGKRIGVISAGNIPLVGFHDFLAVLISGNYYLGKLSSKDDLLLKLISSILIEIEPAFADLIHFQENTISNFNAVIATGSNNSARYFNYYFGKYPHIIRKNRNSIALLTGTETSQQLENLAIDIMQYFGLGCRNVSSIAVPENYDFAPLFNALKPYEKLYSHNKYANNYDYNKSVLLMNRTPFRDTGFLVVKEDAKIASPVAVLNYFVYKNQQALEQFISLNTNQIQCIVGENVVFSDLINFGETQKLKLTDYADNIDTMKFLFSL